ncbi:MAG: FxLYD domain-containing protein [Dehalococcoidia bacterium]
MFRPLAFAACALALAAASFACGGDDDEPEPQPTAIAYDLQIVTQRCASNQETRNVTVTGTVRNMTDTPLESLEAVASFIDNGGQLVDERTQALNTPVLAPAAVSSFELSTPDSAAIEQCIVRFSDTRGTFLDVDYHLVQQPIAQGGDE